MNKITEFKQGHFWLSNFCPVNIILDDTTYRTVEHAYMSAKSDSLGWKAFCKSTYSPGEVKTESHKIQLTSKWNDEYRLKVMWECLLQKYTQEPFRTMLLYTGSLELEEGNTWGDKFYGIDFYSGEGLNHLGKMIMKIRDQLKAKQVDKPTYSLNSIT